ncbi:MAG: amidohydrolase family protein [Actinomycetota bacterium]
MPRQEVLILIRAGRLVDVVAGKVVKDQEILVKGDRIVAVKSRAGAPEGTTIVDLSMQTVLPGMIDCHAHLVGAEEEAGLPSIGQTAAQETLLGVRNARRTVIAGFTSVRDVGTYRAFLDIGLRDAIEAGWFPGPRMMTAGPYLTVTGGGGEITGLADGGPPPDEFRFGVADSAVEVRHRAKAILDGGEDFLKIIATGAVLTRGTDPGKAEYTEEEIRAAVEVADERGSHVAAHAHGPAGIKNAVRAGVRSIEHGSLIDDEAIALMADRGTYLVADIYCGDYIAQEGRRTGWPEETLRKNEETTETQRRGFRKAVEAGVRVAFGTDSGVYPHGDNALQMEYMARHGLSPMGAIRSATLWAAELMRRQEGVGSVTPGKYADLIAVAGDPLEDLARLTDVSFVMKDGEVLKQA